MDRPAAKTHTHCTHGIHEPAIREEAVMWQVHAAFRFGHYRMPEVDVTPALGVALTVVVAALIIHTGM